MLQIVVPQIEEWDEINEKFVYSKGCTLKLEHSLVSLAKWEAKWCKPFLTKKDKTYEEVIDYIKCMTLTQCVDPKIYDHLSLENVQQIENYILEPMTATWFSDSKKKGRNRRIVTAELIYYWMIALGIPFECQKWHLNRLLTLIRVCEAETAPKKKSNEKSLLEKHRALNEARRKKYNTKG